MLCFAPPSETWITHCTTQNGLFGNLLLNMFWKTATIKVRTPTAILHSLNISQDPHSHTSQSLAMTHQDKSYKTT